MTRMGESVTTSFRVGQKNIHHVLAILDSYGVRGEFLITPADGGYVVELREVLRLEIFRLLTALAA
jgi:hypothetical protein